MWCSDENGRTVVEALDPKLIAEVPGNPALAPIANEAGQRSKPPSTRSQTTDVPVLLNDRELTVRQPEALPARALYRLRRRPRAHRRGLRGERPVLHAR